MNYFYIVARYFVSEKRYEIFELLLTKPYYDLQRSNRGGKALVSYIDFRDYLNLFAYRNEKLKLGHQSVPADMLKERSGTSGIDFNAIMQTDFILYFRSLGCSESEYELWYPETLVYASRHHHTFEEFQRSASQKYFDQIKMLIGVESKDELAEILTSLKANTEIRIGGWPISSTNLLGFTNLCTRE